MKKNASEEKTPKTPLTKKEKLKRMLTYSVLCVLVPAAVLVGAAVFGKRSYAWISLCVAVLACVPFFVRFEKKTFDVRFLVMIAALVALSVVGRILFSPLPGFKPVTALVVIAAMYFGGEAGFLTGALTALLSNFWFGQGPWTPFQMFAWGFVGFIAGLLASPMKRSRVLLCVYGAFAGVLFSGLMDVWTVMWMDGRFNLSRYIAAVASSASFTLIYAVSNVVFLLVCARPIGKILTRIRTKYGI